MLAQIELDRGNNVRAAELLERAAPTIVASGRKFELASFRIEQARTLLKAGRREEAASIAMEASAAGRPEPGRCGAELLDPGLRLLGAGRRGARDRALRAGDRASPGDAEPLSRRGVLEARRAARAPGRPGRDDRDAEARDEHSATGRPAAHRALRPHRHRPPQHAGLTPDPKPGPPHEPPEHGTARTRWPVSIRCRRGCSRTSPRLRIASLAGEGVPVVQSAAAAGVALYVARDLIGHPKPFFAPISALIVLGCRLDGPAAARRRDCARRLPRHRCR